MDEGDKEKMDGMRMDEGDKEKMDGMRMDEGDKEKMDGMRERWLQMTFDIGKKMKKRDVKDFIHMMDEDDLSEMDIEEIENGVDLLGKLEEADLCSQANVSLLEETLSTIGRKDLALKVSKYRQGLEEKGFIPIQESERPRSRLSRDHCEEDKYPMNCEPHGKCVILYNTFTGQGGKSERVGNDKDLGNLKELFKKLKYEVDSRELAAAQIKPYLNAIASDPCDCDSLVVFVLSHGDNEGFYTNNGKLCYKELFQICDTDLLKGKPKLFFVSACQGFQNSASPVKEKYANPFGGQEKCKQSKVLDDIPDIFCFTSAAPGSRSIRTEKGTWFVQTFCDVVKKTFCDVVKQKRDISLSDIATQVTYAVHQRVEKIPDGAGGEIVCKMIPNIKENTLNKHVYF